jgi:hypothetical protein
VSVRVFDSSLRFMVESHSRVKVEHLVELDAYGGNGRCACEHFQFRLEPQLRSGEVVPSNATRCHHIIEARDYFTDHVMELIKVQQKENGTERQETQA